MLAYAAQIYCDFSGYSDIAIGCAKWFGFELPQNFNFPYISENIGEFWRRWHISLSTWMRDYLYIPLGGSRKGTVRTYVNLLITMTLCGLWHGASWNFILWGFYNGVLLTGHRFYDHVLTGRPWADRIRGHALFRLGGVLSTFMLVAIGLVMVRSESTAGWLLVEKSLLGWSPGGHSRGACMGAVADWHGRGRPSLQRTTRTPLRLAGIAGSAACRCVRRGGRAVGDLWTGSD